MTLKRNTTFSGVSYEKTRVGETIEADVLNDVAGDDAMTYEILTGKNADGGGGASTNTAHDHSTGNTRLWWPIFTHAWGSPAARENGAGSGPLLIHTTSGTTPKSTTDFVLMAVPFFLDASWVDWNLDLVVDGASYGGDGFLGITMIIYNNTMTEVLRKPLSKVLVDNMANHTHSATFQLSSSGVYVMEFVTDLVSDETQRVLYSMMLMPAYSPAARATVKTQKGPVGTSNIATVPAWQPIDSAIVAADFPINPAALLLAQNQNRIFEEATGLPAPGNATRTVSKGHDHDVTTSKRLSRNVCSIPFGANDDLAELRGNGSRGPYVVNTTARGVRRLILQMPTTTATTGGTTSKLKVVAVFHCAAAGTGKCVLNVASATGTTTTLTQTATGVQLITATSGTSTISFTSAALEEIQMSIKSTAAGATAKPRLLGVCLYFDA